MSSRYDEYLVCKKRGHQKSGRSQMIEGQMWEVCKFCYSGFRWVTTPQEINTPARDTNA